VVVPRGVWCTALRRLYAGGGIRPAPGDAALKTASPFGFFLPNPRPPRRPTARRKWPSTENGRKDRPLVEIVLATIILAACAPGSIPTPYACAPRGASAS
jgi:hypothetical protein